ncbi:MAG: class I SAM-dependent methyltransferase [Anaerolineae bacterium]|nr:class I SAM-dependent methyltransferase [Anaerolineae bacterium]
MSAARPDRKTCHETSQLLLRNLSGIRGSRLLVVNHPRDEFAILLKQHLPGAEVVAFNTDYAVHRYLCHAYVAAGLNPGDLAFGPTYGPLDKPHDLAVVFLPKSRVLAEMTLALVAAALRPGAQVFLVGENGAGIRSSRAVLERSVGPVRYSDAARHCVLFRATRDTGSASFNLDDWAAGYTVEMREWTLRVISLPGVFSHGHLDEGTRLLLETLDSPPLARTLDFGCGAGIIGATIKKMQPTAIVEMIDTSALALEATRRTLIANGLPSEGISPSEVFSNAQGIYKQIVSNPPFHTGVRTDYGAVTAFLKEAAQHLEGGGTLRMVANRFLRYQPLIEAWVGRCRVVAENRLYRVYEGVRSG